MKTSIIVLLVSFSFCNSFLAQISSDGLLAYYNFENNVNDLNSNLYTGTLVGGSFVTDGTNTSLLLDGIDDYLDLSVFADTLRENLNEMSIFFRIKFIEKGDNQTVLSLGNHGESIFTNVFEIEYEKNRFQVETETTDAAINNEFAIDEASNLFTDEWIDILILLEGDTLTYCRNGSEIFKGKYEKTETTSTSLFLGCFGGDNINSCCFFGGQLDDLQFYNRILPKDICDNELEGELNFKLCKGETILVNEIEYSEEGLFSQNLLTSEDCDSLLYITILMEDPIEVFEYYNGCMNDDYSIQIDGVVYNEENPNGIVVLTAENNCDSIINIDLNYNNCFDCGITRPNLGIQIVKDGNGKFELIYGNSNFKSRKIANIDLVISDISKRIDLSLDKRPVSCQIELTVSKLKKMLVSMIPNSRIKL